MKEHCGIGCIECGTSEWWNSGKVWHSTPGCILVKQPGDVVRLARVHGAITLAQLDPTDERAAPFHRLIDAATAGADRLALEVAVAEAVDAFAVVRSTPARYAKLR